MTKITEPTEVKKRGRPPGSGKSTKSGNTEKKLTAAQMREEIEKLTERIQKLEDGAWCYMCNTHKPRNHFYASTNPVSQSKLCPICKRCAGLIALRVDKNGEVHEPTKYSIQEALMYLDKPYIESVFSASIQESSNLVTGRVKNNVWTSYIKNIAMKQYYGLTYKDSDMFREHIKYEDEKTVEDVLNGRENQETYGDFLKNKNDVIRLLGYDPFEKEAISDQPLLYSQLLGMIDAGGDANDDMVRTASCISIVRNFNQQAKIDDAIIKLMGDYTQLEKNSATIKSLQDSKSKVTTMIKDMAAESCISLKNNKSVKRGDNTWTGKLKKVKDLNLREGEVNGFDIWTCKGMKQVIELSDASIFKQLKLDESELSDMIADQRVMIRGLQDERDNYREISRILLRENIDLKDYINENNLSGDFELVDLDELYSRFASNNDDLVLEEVSGDG